MTKDERTIGMMMAQIEALTRRVGRLEGGFISIGAGSTGIIIAALLKQAGYF